MTIIQYLDEVISVPTDWTEIKLKHYEEFYQIKPENLRDRVALVARICNYDADKLLNLPAEMFNIIVDQSFFIFEEFKTDPSAKVTVNGTTYVIPIEEKLSLGAYIDADETQKAGENVISGILAIVCRPAGEAYDDELTEVRAAMFGELPMSDIWPLLAFFLQCRAASEKHTQAFTNLMQAAELLPRNMRHFLNPGAGTNLSQIWLIIKYYILMLLLRFRLRRLSRSRNTGAIKITRTQRKER